MSEKPWTDADTLRELYHGEGLSSREVANRLGCGKKTILRWLDKHGIEKDKSPARKRSEKLDEELVSRLYLDEKMSGHEIASKIGMSANAVYSFMDDIGIEKRSRSDSAKLKEMPDEVVETGAPEWVYDEMRKSPANLTVNNNGHVQWRIPDRGKYRSLGVHRLTAIMDGADPHDVFGGMHVHHKNGVPWDNRPANLEILEKGEHHSLHNNPNKRLEHEY